MRVVPRTLVVAVVFVALNLLGDRVPAATGGQNSPTVGRSDREPDTAVERVRITETRKGKRLWEVEADRGEMFEDQAKAILIQVVEPVRIIIYNERETLTTLAEKVIIDLRTKDLQFIGHVRSESSQGTKMFAERVNWSAGKRQIHTDGPIVIEKEGYQVRGKGMVADTVLERVTIQERIASEITMPGGKEQKP